MSVLDYQKCTEIKLAYDADDANLYIIITSEHIMANGFISLSYFQN